jgi:hypothetical protein
MSRFKSAGTTEHGYFEERISAYLDGELTPHEHEAVEHHLETCSACQWDLETLGQAIQWTRELPTLTVPRVFTIPVPAEPERASWRRWNFLPVLQGATALIAVLLVFAVAGDLMLGRVGMVLAPDTAPQQELAPSSTDVFLEVTVEVEKAVEEPAAEPAPEMVVAETVVVESEVVVTPTEAPMALRMSPTAPLVSGEALAPVAPGTEGAWKNGEEEARAAEAPPPEASADALEADVEAVPVEEGAVAGGGEPTLSLPAPSPPISDTARTAVAAQLALAPEMERDEATVGTSRGLGVNWLRVVEVSLGGILVLMVAATVFFTIERRRAR